MYIYIYVYIYSAVVCASMYLYVSIMCKFVNRIFKQFRVVTLMSREEQLPKYYVWPVKAN